MSIERLQTLKRKLAGGNSGKRLDNPDELIGIHHLLMKEYGWISVDEFRRIPLPTLWNLLECIKKQYEKNK